MTTIRTNITLQTSLPSLQYWLNPNYVGRISEFDFNELGIDVNLPGNWLDDFPDHNYKFLSLVKLIPVLGNSEDNVGEAPVEPGIAAEKFSSNWIDYYSLFSESLKTFGTKKAVTKKNSDGEVKKERKPTLTRYMRVTESKVLKTLHLNSNHSTLASLNHFIRTRFTYPWNG
jgi:hypothetical protein